MLQQQLIRLRSVNWYGIAFDVALVLVTMGGAWWGIQDGITWINFEFLLLVLNSSAIVFFHAPKTQNIDYGVLAILFFIGLTLAVLPVLSTPPLRAAIEPMLHGDLATTMDRLQTVPGDPRNFIMVVGACAVYGSLAGMARRLYMRLIRKFFPNQ